MDLIKKRNAIDCCFHEDGRFRDIRYAVEDIRRLQPIQQWVPCSKRLPESNSERIILLYDNGLISGGKYLGDRTFDIDFQDNNKKTKIIAWMPLPEPHKESEK